MSEYKYLPLKADNNMRAAASQLFARNPKARPVDYYHAMVAAAKEIDQPLVGRTVSMDVSTGDHDAGRRLYGNVIGINGPDKVILCELIEDNKNTNNDEKTDGYTDILNTPAIRQYYYKENGCTAADRNQPDCICWHEEGQWPHLIDNPTTWRINPAYIDMCLDMVAEASGVPLREHSPLTKEGMIEAMKTIVEDIVGVES